jgi:hypothetical protein
MVMKIGSGHNWKYKTHRWTEKKVSPHKWTFTTGQSKGRNTSAPRKSGMPTGSKLVWMIRGTQTMYKKDKDHYTGVLKGTKFLKSYKLPNKKEKRIKSRI